MKKTEKTIEEEIMEKEISTVEKQRLSAVFNQLCADHLSSTKGDGEKKFGMKQLVSVLTRLEYSWTK